MDKIAFDYHPGKMRQLFFWATLALAVLAFIASLLFFLGGEPLFVLVEIFTGVALLIFLLALAMLLTYFITRPEVKEKRRVNRQMDKIQKDIDSAQHELAGALQTMRTTNDHFSTQKQQEQEQFNEKSTRIRENIERLELAQEEELADALASIQKAHLEKGLKGLVLDPGELPGIGPMLAEKLEQAGILTALDINQDAIQAIEGFGESKALSLTRWRESIEFRLLAEQPLEIDDETRQPILEKYAQQILALNQEQDAAQSAMQQRLEELRQREAQELAGASGTEMSARQLLSSLEIQKQEVKAHLVQFERINLMSLLIAILSAGQDHWQKRTGAYIWLFGFVLLGMANIALLIATLI